MDEFSLVPLHAVDHEIVSNSNPEKADESAKRADDTRAHDARASDYPDPHVLKNPIEINWYQNAEPAVNHWVLGRALATIGDLYRSPDHVAGLVLASRHPNVPLKVITKGADFSPIIGDRIVVTVWKDGDIKGRKIPVADLHDALRSEVFLQRFRPLDQRADQPLYLPDFKLCEQGYQDGGPGHRILYIGPTPTIRHSPTHINAFLDVMEFASPADRTNTVAAALTVMLRNHWPGGKPLIAVTATKSHAGKDTIITFASGRTPRLSVSYEATDWAMQKNFSELVNANPNVGIVNVENIRLPQRNSAISSSFLERLLTDPQPVLYSTGSGSTRPRSNDLVIAASTNDGAISEDLMNRALPIHLVPRGNVEDRRSPIGDPRNEYLPRCREEIEAELRGMMDKWNLAGRPLAANIRHPFRGWAATVGGILMVNNFTDFLANYSERKTCDDPLKLALGTLGAQMPDKWMRAREWAALCRDWGLVKQIVPANDRENDRGRERGIGVVFSDHVLETFVVEMENEKLTLRLEKQRARWGAPEPHVRYRFAVLDQQPMHEDAES